MAGATITRTATAEHLAERGEVLVDEATAQALARPDTIAAWRTEAERGEKFAVITPFASCGEPLPSLCEALPPIDPAVLRPYIHALVYERELAGQGSFLTEFRPCGVVFVRFTGIEYDVVGAQSQLDAFI